MRGCHPDEGGDSMTYSVSLAQRLDVHEGQGLVALKELEGGNLTCKRVSWGWLYGRFARDTPPRSSSAQHTEA